MASGPFTLAQLARAVGMSTEEVELCLDCMVLQPPRRRRSRSDDGGFHEEHLTRLRFVKQALLHGFSLDMIAEVVDDQKLVTCNDVYRLAVEQLNHLRHGPASNDPMVFALEALIDCCSRKGGRHDCEILQALEEKARKAR
jgi:DNA-binding transcriptional MerR regulator